MVEAVDAATAHCRAAVVGPAAPVEMKGGHLDLILWRHGEALEPQEGGSEFDGSLTNKGERQAHRMAVWLNRNLPSSTRVLSSPARPAVQTAEALDRKVRTVPALAPGASVEAILHAVRWPDAREPVLVVAHQPTLGYLASHLLAGLPEPWTVRKGSVWWIRARERNGQRQVVLHAVVSPELI